MEKVIEIDILDKHDLVEKYNDQRLSQELISYILQEAAFVEKRDKIKIIVDNHCDVESDFSKLIQDGLSLEYNRLLKIYHLTNIRQIGLFILGISFLFLASLVTNEGIWKELLLIGGWVPIWEVIEIELFSDLEGRRKIAILKKLIKSEIVIKK